MLRLHETEPDLAREIDRHIALYYPQYERGVLLVAGGMSDQPARFLELMARIEGVKSNVEAKYLEIKQKESERKD
jgi:hypothetical protein